MKSRDVINSAFERGAGITLSEARESNTGQAVHRLYETLEASLASDPGMLSVYKNGHLATGAFVHQLKVPRGVFPAIADMQAPDEAARQLRADIHLLGLSLINKAAELLPPSLLAEAIALKQLKAREQYRVLRQVSDQLVELNHALGGTDSEVESGSPVRRVFLPAELVNRGNERRTLSCLGLGQLLLAFLQRSGLRYYLASPIFSARLKCAAAEMAWSLNLVLGLNAKHRPTPGYLRGTAVKLETFMWNSYVRWREFHVAAVVELEDGRWVLMDPYQECTTLIPRKHSGIQAATDVLDLTALAAPGLHVNVTDGGRFKAQLHRATSLYLGEVDRILETSAELSRRFAKANGELEACIDAILDIPLYRDALLASRRKEGDEGEPRDLLRRALVHSKVAEEADAVSKFQQEADYRNRCFTSVWAYPLLCNLINLQNRLTKRAEAGWYCHPGIELAQAAYSIGWRVLSDLAKESGCRTLLQRLVPETFSQIGLCLSMYLAPSNSVREVVKAMSDVHPRTMEALTTGGLGEWFVGYLISPLLEWRNSHGGRRQTPRPSTTRPSDHAA